MLNPQGSKQSKSLLIPSSQNVTNRYKSKTVNLDVYRFCNLANQFKVKKPKTLDNQQFNITQCKDSQFFIFDTTANLYVDKCENCFIFCAPCQSTVFIRDCKNVKIIAATKQFRMRDSENIEVSLYCTTQPVIESSKNIIFTSFTRTYGYVELEQQFKKLNMSVFNNHWSQVYDFTKQNGSNFKILPNKQVTCNWKKALQQASLQLSLPQIPHIFNFQSQPSCLAFFYSPTIQQQLQLCHKFIITKSSISKSFKGEVQPQIHDKFKQHNPKALINNFICFKIPVNINDSIKNKLTIIPYNKQLQDLIFPSF